MHTTIRELPEEVLPLIDAPAFYGPPIIFVLGPWLLLVLLIIPPAALLITLTLAFLVVAAALVALIAVLASPYLLMRHLRARSPARRHQFASVRRDSPRKVGEPTRELLPHG
jgi:hypothetical protein